MKQHLRPYLSSLISHPVPSPLILSSAHRRNTGHLAAGKNDGVVGDVLGVDGERELSDQSGQLGKPRGQLPAERGHGRPFGQLDFDRVATGHLPGQCEDPDPHFHVTVNSFPGAPSKESVSGIRP